MGDIQVKGKNFSRNNVNGKRRAGDFYQTPKSMTLQFLQNCPILRFPVLEPAAGAGAMASVLMRLYGIRNVDAYDINPIYGSPSLDFLKEKRRFPTVITNPPFSLSTEFILKCKEVATDRFSLLMPIDYLHGIERYEKIYSARDRWKLTSIHIYVRRAMMSDMVRDDGLYGTGMVTWAWFTWKRYPRLFSWMNVAPKVFFLNNNDDVLRTAARKKE